MTTISGDNITYTSLQLFQALGGIIERTGLTGNSTDTICDATSIISTFRGTSSLNPGGNFLEVFILNNSTYSIILQAGSGMTMQPGPTDVINAGTIKRYTIVVKSDLTVTIFNLDYNGTPLNTSKLITSTIQNTGNISLGSSNSILNINPNGDINVYGNIFQYSSVASINTDSNTVYTTGQLLGGFIKRTMTNNNVTDTLPTAASLISSISDAKVGTAFSCYIQNASTQNNYSITLQGSTGLTISGSQPTIQRYTTFLVMFVVIDPTPGSESAVCYILGTLQDAKGGNAALITNVTTSSYSITQLDSTLNVNYGGICVLTLPQVASVGQKRYNITDSSGLASVNQIIVNPANGDTILGADSFLINTNYGSISMYNDEDNNWILY